MTDADVAAPDAVRSSSTDPNRVLHFVKRGDHPRALCGHVVSDSWDPTAKSQGRDICTQCQKIASQLMREGKAWR